jgi:PadR family transcriptional regulator, regulatory protein PadR
MILLTPLFYPGGRGLAHDPRRMRIEFGSLYPALRRLELKGWISAWWEISERNRKAKFYRLTPAGKRSLVK